VRVCVIAVTALMASALMGCSDFREWSYQPDPHVVRAPLMAKTVVVRPLNDLRPRANNTTGAFYACFVPLVPYGRLHYNLPEQAPVWSRKGVTPFRPTQDVARAIAAELDNSGLFSEVVFSAFPADEELALNGDLIVLNDERWMTCYGITYFFGDLLWLMGAPMGGTTNELTMKLTLVDRATQDVLWSQTFSESDKKTEWIYAMKVALRHPELLKTELRQAITSMEAALSH